MSKVSKALRMIQCSFLMGLLTIASQAAFANGIAVTSDSVTITASAGPFSQAKNLATLPGTIPNTDSIPTAAITSDLTFTFNVAAAAGKTITAGTYTFAAGMFIDQDATSRRLEMSVPGISLTFDASGNITSGSIAAGSNVKVSGRSSDGSATAVITLTNTLLSITDSTFAITAGAQITEIQTSPNVILQDLTTTFSAAASYDYAVFLNQLTGSDLTFGLTNGTTYFGCPSTNPMLLTGQTSFAGASALVGRMGIGQAAGGSPTAYTGTCTVVGGGGGGGGTTTTAATQTTAVNTATTALTTAISSSETFTDAVATQLESLTADTTSAATSVGAGLSDGSVTVATAFELLGSIAIQFGNLSALPAKISSDDPNATAKNDQITTAQNSLLGALTSIAGGLKEKSFSTTEAATLSTVLSTLNTKVAELILAQLAAAGVTLPTALSTGTLVKDISETVSSLESSLGNILGNPTFTMTSGLFASIQDVSQSSGKGIFAELGTNLGLTQTYTNDANAKAILANNTTLLSRLVDAIGVNLGIEIDVDETATNAAVVAAGLTGSSVSALTSDLRKYVKADGLQIDSSGSVASASSLLGTALGADTISVNAITGAVNYTNGGSSSVAFVKSVMPAPSIIPTGLHILSDGSTLINDGAVMFQLVSGSNNILDFAGAIQSVGSGSFTTSITDSGIIKLTETATGAIFSSTISTSALGSATATATTTFEAATGNPADSTYRFVVQYDDGTRQEILPAISDAAFFTSVGNVGFQVTTDRRTGVVNIDGFSFRPDFFQTPLTAADLTYHAANADSSGVAYRAVDANGDGVTDYQVLTASGVQTVYTLP